MLKAVLEDIAAQPVCVLYRMHAAGRWSVDASQCTFGYLSDTNNYTYLKR